MRAPVFFLVSFIVSLFDPAVSTKAAGLSLQRSTCFKSNKKHLHVQGGEKPACAVSSQGRSFQVQTDCVLQ